MLLLILHGLMKLLIIEVVINPQKDKKSQISRLIDELDILDISKSLYY